MYTITIGKKPDKVLCTKLYSVDETTKKHLENRYFLYFYAERSKWSNRTIGAVVTVDSRILTCTDSVGYAGIGKVLVAEWLRSENILWSRNDLKLIQQGYVSLTWAERGLIMDRLKELAELQKDKDKE